MIRCHVEIELDIEDSGEAIRIAGALLQSRDDGRKVGVAIDGPVVEVVGYVVTTTLVRQ